MKKIEIKQIIILKKSPQRIKFKEKLFEKMKLLLA